MISFSKHAFRFVLLILIGFGMAACGGSASISNGANLSNLSGKAGSQKNYTVKLPEGTISLLVQVAGSPAITLDILDSAGNSMYACWDPQICVLHPVIAGTYTVRLSADADYSGVNLSASWGGPGVSVLKNNAPEGALQGDGTTIWLKSLYLSDDAPLVFFSSDVPAAIELLDQDGTPINCTQFPCQASPLPAGLYFVRLASTETYSGASLKATWGDALPVLPTDGKPTTVAKDGTTMQLLGVMDVNEAASQLMFATPSNLLFPMLMDLSGNPVEFNCDGSDGLMCVSSILNPGQYYLVGDTKMTPDDIQLTLHLASPQSPTLVNATTTEPVNAQLNDIFIESFYINDANTSIAFVATWNSEPSVFNALGQRLCVWNFDCILPELPTGLYFTVTRVMATDYFDTVSSSFASGSPGAATLTEGEPNAGTIAFGGQSIIESFYVDDSVSSFLVVPKYSTLMPAMSVFDSTGNPVGSCSNGACFGTTTSPGTYFVLLDTDLSLEANTPYALSLGLGGPQHTSLIFGESTEPQSAQLGDTLIKSFYIDKDGSNAAITASMLGAMTVYDAQFNQLCAMPLCILPGLSTGVYYAVFEMWNPEADQLVNFAMARGDTEFATLNNGQIKHITPQYPGERRLESFFVAPGSETVAVAVSDDALFVTIVDVQNEFIAFCQGHTLCLFNPAEPGMYYAYVDAETDSEFTIGYALGGKDVSSLQANTTNAEQEAHAGDLFINSFYRESNADVTGFIGAINTITTLYDSAGNALCTDRFCSLADVPAGPYFAMSDVFEAPFIGNDNDVSFAVAHANLTTSLGNGGTAYDLAKTEGELRLISVVLPGLEDMGGVQHLQLGLSMGPYELQVFHPSGTMLARCLIFEICNISPVSGPLFIAVTSFLEDLEVPAAALSVAWSDDAAAQVRNGETYSATTVDDLILSIRPFHLETVSDVQIDVQATNAYLFVMDAFGNGIQSCDSDCTISALPPGDYFLELKSDQTLPQVPPPSLDFRLQW